MKKLITILCFCLVLNTLSAQAPQKISYQSVVRNANGTLAASKQVGVRLSIIQGNEFGASVYVETQTPTTNTNGLFSIIIGNGTPVLGVLSNVNWANGPYFLKTEIDPNGASSYSISGTLQLMSVPYALYSGKATAASFSDSSNFAKAAAKAYSIDPGAVLNPMQLSSNGAQYNQVLRWDGNGWVPSDEFRMQPGRGLTESNGVINSLWDKGKTGPYLPFYEYLALGLDSAISPLHIRSYGTQITHDFYMNGSDKYKRNGVDVGYVGIISDTNSLDIGSIGGSNVNIVTGNYPQVTVTSSGNVGVGTTNPSAKLDVNGTLKASQFQMTTGASNGRVMTSDASGNAYWGAVGGRLVGFYNAQGVGNNVTAANAFIGPTINITISAGQKVFVVVNRALGSTVAGGANNLNLYMGYLLSGQTTPVIQGGGTLGLACQQNTRQLFGLQFTFSGLAAGTYTFGMVGSSSSFANWNWHEYGYLTALVFD